MLPVTKQRITKMSQWLMSLGYRLLARAETGSTYLEVNELYIGKCTIRLSDHFSKAKLDSHVQVIMAPNTKFIQIICGSFTWIGSFKEAKDVLFTLMYTRQNIVKYTAPDELAVKPTPAVKVATIIPTPGKKSRMGVFTAETLQNNPQVHNDVLSYVNVRLPKKNRFACFEDIPEHMFEFTEKQIAVINAKLGK